MLFWTVPGSPAARSWHGCLFYLPQKTSLATFPKPAPLPPNAFPHPVCFSPSHLHFSPQPGSPSGICQPQWPGPAWGHTLPSTPSPAAPVCGQNSSNPSYILGTRGEGRGQPTLRDHSLGRPAAVPPIRTLGAPTPPSPRHPVAVALTGAVLVPGMAADGLHQEAVVRHGCLAPAKREEGTPRQSPPLTPERAPANLVGGQQGSAWSSLEWGVLILFQVRCPSSSVPQFPPG